MGHSSSLEREMCMGCGYVPTSPSASLAKHKSKCRWWAKRVERLSKERGRK